jgi:hypothetical protein
MIFLIPMIKKKHKKRCHRTGCRQFSFKNFPSLRDLESLTDKQKKPPRVSQQGAAKESFFKYLPIILFFTPTLTPSPYGEGAGGEVS